jgi:hypothetical protein
VTVPRPREADGFTLIETVIVVALIGLVSTVLAAAVVSVLRIAPATEFRVDDARTTRGLHTWLARDIASTPPNAGIVPGEGGFLFGGPSPNACGATGTFVLYLNWIDAETGESFHSNYTIEGSGPSGVITRTICSSGPLAPSAIRLTTQIDPNVCPAMTGYAVPDPTSGPVVNSVDLCFTVVQADSGLNAGGGARSPIRLSVASRNDVEDLP